MELWISFFMWLVVVLSIIVGVCALMLEFILRDTVEYDMQFLWNHRFTLEELHLDRET